MPRNMSVTLTEQAVVERRKTVTRRLGWQFLKAGDRLTLCRKVMGRRHSCTTCDPGKHEAWCSTCSNTGYVVDPLVRLANVEVIDVRREPLRNLTVGDIEREGVDPDLWRTAGWSAYPVTRWVEWFCAEQGVAPDTTVTRIEWRYLDEGSAS